MLPHRSPVTRPPSRRPDRRGVPLAALVVVALVGAALMNGPAGTGDGPGGGVVTAPVTPLAGSTAGRFDRPRTGFAGARTVLRERSADADGLDRAPLLAADARLDAWTRPDPVTGRALFAGAVGLHVQDGAIVHRHVTGSAVAWTGDLATGTLTELPPAQRVPMRTDTVFDVASISKLFTSLVVMQEVEAGRVDLGAPVARYVPEYAANGKAAITVRQLLTHTSGAAPFLPLWRDWPDRASRLQAAITAAPRTTPGATYVYSDLNLITLGVLVERTSGRALDVLVRDGITAPLGLPDTGYNPSAPERTAATEFQTAPPRGVVRGQVHDENAWSLGGVAGHAGIFSTANDLAVLGQTVLNGGAYAGTRILREDSVTAMLTDLNPQFPGNAHGLGFELGQIWYMGGLSGPATAGHTGFTGTSLVIDPLSRSVAVLLTNRVHPSRAWGSPNPARTTWATALARAMAVRPTRGPSAWTAEPDVAAPRQTALLSTVAPVPAGGRAVDVRFDAFVHTEPTDVLLLEVSHDGGTTWTGVPVTATGPGAPAGPVGSLSGTGTRAWWTVRAQIAPGPTDPLLRWRHSTDASGGGRGVLLDDLRAEVGGRRVLDVDRHPDAVLAAGWRPTGRP